MPHEKHITIEGRITDVFAHRFVIETADGARTLADLGPKGAEIFRLEAGQAIVAEGEMKPSELKVTAIARAGEDPVAVPHKPKPHHPPHHHDHPPHHHPHAEPEAARRAVEKAGLHPLGEPRRKPKHFEVLARRGAGFVECHVALDGHIRKEKPVDPADHKWAGDIAKAA